MPEFYFVKDKVCDLIKRNEGGNSNSQEFILEAPNGEGIFEADLKMVHENSYVDARGNLRTPHNHAQLILKFYYSSHYMNLIRLLEADVIRIPYALSLNPADEVIEPFVLLNEEVVYNYFSGFVGRSTSSEQIPYGDLMLEFGGAHPKPRGELMNLIYYNESDDEFADTEFGLAQDFDSTEVEIYDNSTRMNNVSGLRQDFDTVIYEDDSEDGVPTDRAVTKGLIAHFDSTEL